MRLGIQFTFFDLWLCCGIRLVIWHGTRINTIIVGTGQGLPSTHCHVVVLTTASISVQLKQEEVDFKLVFGDIERDTGQYLNGQEYQLQNIINVGIHLDMQIPEMDLKVLYIKLPGACTDN